MAQATQTTKSAKNVFNINRYPRAATTADQILHKGDVLFWMGDKLTDIFLVRSGSLKLYRIAQSGELQILGFYQAGDIVGLDALDKGISNCIAEALDTIHVERVDVTDVVSGIGPVSASDVLTKGAMALQREYDLTLVLSQRAADRRLAWFLLEYARGQAERGYSAAEFSLPMSRTDLAHYLGLALETTCRELAKMCELGILCKSRRSISILDHDALEQLAEGTCADSVQATSARISATTH